MGLRDKYANKVNGNGESKAIDKAKALSFHEKAAEQGDADAQFNCGIMYYKGEGTAIDNAKALYWFQKAADQGHTKAQFFCQQLKEAAEAERKRLFKEAIAAGKAGDQEMQLNLFEQAAQLGDGDSQFNCGIMYYKGEGTAIDNAKALYWFQKAADQGSELAQTMCKKLEEAQARENRDRLFEEAIAAGEAGDKEKQLNLFEQAAQLGSVAAMYNCGVLYENRKEAEKAIQWYTKAYESGYKDAACALGDFYDSYFNWVEAKHWYEIAVAAGDERPKKWLNKPKRLMELVRKYHLPVPENPEFFVWVEVADRAFFLLKMYAWDEASASKDQTEKYLWTIFWYADQDDGQALCACGEVLREGKYGVTMNKAEALTMYQKAANQGIAEAQFYCGIMYGDGEGTATDKAAALYWYEKAAEQGIPEAQFNCGRMYYQGEGAPVKKWMAKAWWSKAAKQTQNTKVASQAEEVLEAYF